MQLLRSISVVAAVLSAAVVSALPTASPQGIAEMIDSLSKRSFDGHQITGCSLSGAILPKSDGKHHTNYISLFHQIPIANLPPPLSGPTLLADPDPGLSVTRVVLGRGTQNYTCADSKDTTVPSAAGALAILYDASCLAANYPSLLHELPDALVALSGSIEIYTGAILQRISGEPIILGKHYFSDFTTPVFDFRLTAGQTGIFTGVKDQAVPASAYAAKGGSPDQQFGAVDWLRLKSVTGKSVGYKLAYRVHTAGGKAPSTCKGLASSFTIEYAAEYCEYFCFPTFFAITPLTLV